MIKNENWIKNFIKPDSISAKGIISRGKYTFPKMPAFPTKVVDVEEIQPEK